MNKASVMNWVKERRSLTAILAFCAVAFVMIAIGVFVFRVPVLAMCVLVMIEAGIAVMLHNAEIWVHGGMVLAEIIAGFCTSLAPVILCAVVYVAATAALQIIGKDK